MQWHQSEDPTAIIRRELCANDIDTDATQRY
jgi:hypothetical protein